MGITLFLLSADVNGLLEIAAIGAVIIVPVAQGDDGPRMTVFCVVPGHLLSDLCRKSAPFRLLVLNPIRLVQCRANAAASPAA